MRSRWKLILTTAAATAIIVACGTGTAEEATPSQENALTNDDFEQEQRSLAVRVTETLQAGASMR
jgi:hypothetical protein